MTIWHQPIPSVGDIMARDGGTMIEHLGIEVVDIGDDSVTARMPVDHRTVQPQGRLHGGASVALAETVGSIAANLTLDIREKLAVGLDINANHVRPASGGFVQGIASPEAIGRTTQVWSIRITDEEDRLVCIARLTMAVIPLSRG